MTIQSVTEPAAPAPETKAAGLAAEPNRGGDVTGAFEEFMSAFADYRDTNDRRLVDLERRGAADPVTLDKLDRLDRVLDEQKRRMDDLVLKAARPRLGPDGRAALSSAAEEHKQAFQSYMRGGGEAGLKQLEGKALSIGSNQDGGFLVPAELERSVNRRMALVSPIRAIASNRQISSNIYNKPYATSGPAVGWAAETASRPETVSPILSLLAFPTMELYAMPSATTALLDDGAIDIEQWIAEEVDQVFAEQEGTAFVTGDGVNRPRGFLAYPRVANASWSWNNLGYIVTGVSGAFPTTNPSDRLVDLIYALKAGPRANGTWIMNRGTQAEIRKMKDTQGNYLWQPPAVAGQQATLMSFPVAEAEEMPSIAADAFAVAFGDFRRGYLVVDRIGMRVLRDPYSAKPYVLFYTTKRVGGGIQDFDAIKLLKFGTS